MPVALPNRSIVRAALESGTLRLVDRPTDPWFGTHAQVGDRNEVRYTNTLVVRTTRLRVDEQLLWNAPVSDGQGGLVPAEDATIFPTTTAKRQRPGKDVKEGDEPETRPKRSRGQAAVVPAEETTSPSPSLVRRACGSAPAATVAANKTALPTHLPPEKFELWQITLPDRTRGCLPRNRIPANRQFKKMVALHIYMGDSLPNVRISHEGTMHITGCLHLGLVGELLLFLRGLPGIEFDEDTPFVVDTVLTNVRFVLGYDVDRWMLRQAVNCDKQRWSAVYEPQSEHVAVSVSCRTDAPTKPTSSLPCFSVRDGWSVTTIADMMRFLRPGAQPRRKAPRHTFRVFANGTVTFACVWPPELTPVFSQFMQLMQAVRDSVAFAGRATASQVNEAACPGP